MGSLVETKPEEPSLAKEVTSFIRSSTTREKKQEKKQLSSQNLDPNEVFDLDESDSSSMMFFETQFHKKFGQDRDNFHKRN